MGTMMGVAPPNMQAEIAKAKATAKQKAEEAVASQPPSKLKGTMMGIAPPDMPAEIDKAKAALVATQLQENQLRPAAAQPTSPVIDELGGTQAGSFAEPQMTEKQASVTARQRVKLPADQTTTAASTPLAIAALSTRPPSSFSQATPSTDLRDSAAPPKKLQLTLWIIVAFLIIALGLIIAALLV